MRGATFHNNIIHRFLYVSIHAPMRGATSMIFSSVRGASFNPRAHAGRDRPRPRAATSPKPFQSTRPCGARHAALARPVLRRLVSIHAPMRGATDDQFFVRRLVAVSIHAPMRGATGL